MSDYPKMAARDGGYPVIRVVDVHVYRLVGAAPEFLLLRRTAGTIYGGQWRMVAGKIAAGETAWQAALRELVEETGLRLKSFWAVPSVNAFYEWQHDRVNVIPVFAAEVHDLAPVLDREHDAFEWLDPTTAAERLSWPEHRRLVRLVADMVGDVIPPDMMIPLHPR